MMDNKIKLAVVAIIVIVVIAAVAAYALSNDDDDKKDYSETTIGEIGTYVPIYGNATGDLYINQEDVDMLQQIVDGGMEWDKSKAPYADANQDGKITQEDIDLVKKIINVESCEVMYEDYYGDVTKVKFPLKDVNIAVTYYQQAEACAILGVLDKVNVASKAATVYGSMWPSLKNAVEWGTTGSSAITDDAVEKMIDKKVKLVVCTPRTENRELAQRLYNEQGISFIQLWYNGNYCISTIQTMGILMDQKERSQAYMDYCNGIIKDISSKVTDSMKKSCLVISGYNAQNDQISILGNERHGSYVLIAKYLGNAYYENGTNQFGFVYHNVEWLIENSNKFDYIINCMSGNSGYSDDQSTGTYYTAEAYNTKFEGIASYFEKTDAYKNGNIIGSVYPNTFGFSAYPFLKLIAAQMYGVYTIEEAYAEIQNWFDNYNVVNIDVTKNGPVSYTGSEYKTSYDQLKV